MLIPKHTYLQCSVQKGRSQFPNNTLHPSPGSTLPHNLRFALVSGDFTRPKGRRSRLETWVFPLAEETMISIRTIKALAWERLSLEKLVQAGVFSVWAGLFSWNRGKPANCCGF